MLLRREIQLILWVSALSLMGLALFRATLTTSSMSLAEFDSVATGTLAGSDVISNASLIEGRGWKRSFVDAYPGLRTLFPRLSQTSAGAADITPTAPPATEPELRGILGTEAGPKGVFVDPATGNYVVVGVGGVVAGYAIEAIESGQLLARSPTGKAVTFYLRGAGELP